MMIYHETNLRYVISTNAPKTDLSLQGKYLKRKLKIHFEVILMHFINRDSILLVKFKFHFLDLQSKNVISQIRI